MYTGGEHQSSAGQDLLRVSGPSRQLCLLFHHTQQRHNLFQGTATARFCLPSTSSKLNRMYTHVDFSYCNLVLEYHNWISFLYCENKGVFSLQAITFNRSARELFDFMARLMRAKKKMARQEAEAAGVNSQTPELPSIPLSDSGEERVKKHTICYRL